MADDYPAFLRKLEALKRKVGVATGELKATMGELSKYGYKTLDAAIADVPKLQEQAAKTATDLTTKKQALEAEYKDLLEGL